MKKTDSNSAYFKNTSCEYYPCHEADKEKEFNCLFCFCPLYSYGVRCGGNFSYTKDGIKDCSSCMIPHKKDNYEFIIQRIKELSTSK